MPSVEYQREWRRKNPEKAAASRRREHLKKYGMTPEDYAGLLLMQGGVCAIDGCHRDTSGKGKRLHIDHSHDTGEVRGLLCGHHNVALGYAQDSIEELEALISYLKEHQ